MASDLETWAREWPTDSSSSESATAKSGDANYYFNSYAHFGIHLDMISDIARTSAYQRAIMNCAHLIKDKIVLDVGAGSGILSIFAAKAGAKHVYALECSSICGLAREIVQLNGLSDRITFVQGKAEEVTLPGVETVDVLISEWMGYGLLYESMLDTVIYCRDRWLSADGVMFPDRAIIKAALVEDFEFTDNSLLTWKSISGYDFSDITTQVRQESIVDVYAMDDLVSTECILWDWDLKKVTVKDVDFAANFTVKFTENSVAHSFLIYFDTPFPNSSALLKTGPESRPTHWKQCAFHLPTPVVTSKDGLLSGRFAMRKSKQNPRDLDVKLDYTVGDMEIPHSKVYRIR